MYMPQGSTAAGGRAAKKRRPDNATQTTPSRSGLGPSLGIEVKTKFPVARIKRIMQADEDVGKVAQATPTAVCEFCSSLLQVIFQLTAVGLAAKALELFMITLVTKAATEAGNRQSKRVTAAHLKQAVLADENLDFLQEIVSKIPDPTEKKARAKSEDSAEPEEGAKKKRAGARRKKVEADDD
jgi:Dr1-associated corepressor